MESKFAKLWRNYCKAFDLYERLAATTDYRGRVFALKISSTVSFGLPASLEDGMSRTNQNEYRYGRLWFGYDYKKQAWVDGGRYMRCGHPSHMLCKCFGRLHEGEETKSMQGWMSC